MNNNSSALSARFEESKTPDNPIRRNVVDQISNKIKDAQYKFTETECTICNSGEYQLLAQEDRDSIRHPVVICGECGLIFTNPRLTEKSYADFYEEEYRLLNEGSKTWKSERFTSQRQKAETIYSPISNNIKLEGIDVFDIGTGPGGTLDYFEEKGHATFGCDLDPSCVQFANKKGLSVQHGSFNEVNLDRQPDLIILSHVVEHFPDPLNELKSLREIAHSNSVIYVEALGVKELSLTSSWYNGDFKQQLQTAHTHYFTAKSLQNLMRLAGFKQVYSDEYIHGIYKTTNKPDTIEVNSDYKDVIAHLILLEWGLKFHLNDLAQMTPVELIQQVSKKIPI
jgi:2-polyprenyl-3-methyl-5-hydroxy-6-metoxy-1,4-benzoquinol methylase